MNIYPNKYFYKILLFGIIISAFPVSLAGIFTYSKSSDTIQRKSDHAVQEHLHQIQNGVEQVLRTTDHSLNYFVNSSFLIQTLSESLNVDQFQLLRQIKQELNHLQTFDTGISDIILLSREQEWYIDNIGLHRLDKYKKGEWLLPYFQAPLDSMWDVGAAVPDPSRQDRPVCTENIRLIKKLPIHAAHKKGLAVAEIPVCHLGSLFSFDKNNESVMMMDREGRVFYHTNAGLLGGMDVQASVLDLISRQDERNGQFQVNEKYSEFTVTYRKSDFNNWTYISMISIRELTKESRAIGWFTSMLCLSLLVLSLGVAWVVSRMIYSPVKKLFHVSSKVFKPAAGEQRKDGFEYLAEQIHDVVDKNTELQDRLHTQVEQLRILFVVKLLGGQIGAREISEKLPSLGYQEGWTRLSVVTVQIDTLEGTKYHPNDEDLLLYAIHNIVEELIAAEQRLAPVVQDQSLVTVVFSRHSGPDELKQELYQLTQHIQRMIDTYLHLPVSVGISLPYLALHETCEAYQESREALKNRLRLGGNSIIFYEELPQGGYPLYTFFSPHFHNDLSDAIKLADREQVDRLLAAFFQDLLVKKAGPVEYEVWAARLVIDLIQLTHSLGIPYMSFTDNHSVFEQMFKLRTLKEMQDWLRQVIIEPIMVTVEERLHAQYRNISEHIIDIIHREYEQDISLDSLASRLHYNPSYISSVFRKETGVLFSEYLASYRHGKAVAYLLETDMPIREIAAKLQFNNPQNFIRSFRRIEGMTPGQYREKSRLQ
ncbi:helix-turn-helix domain-containing protein [Paenibacillus puerhi]|uniref:helix-turn-helix domain-containing protein n=1 Tax=Paenibacillus puerhi TaxID=2692622 RepID=UPI0013592A38|nr:helix-turn-helix domain-containing protein [Paenibacillus puerhi]